MKNGLERKSEETKKVTELNTEGETVPVKGGFVYMEVLRTTSSYCAERKLPIHKIKRLTASTTTAAPHNKAILPKQHTVTI
ncbi:hypothetical protein DQG23_35505 [Paenibacillus contaminans]|uniref:Uncharacterized protein n=1 Tax=Paenibacillus contaminans TaxID=450362 RepID=A0A329LVQ9_9BACL|nr:hypothetical protein DQG23_35505 [Paenibacillus contaminans]